MATPSTVAKSTDTHPAGRQILHGVDQMGQVAAEAVELPDHEHVALPQGPQAAVEARPVVADAGGEVVVEVDRVVDASGPRGVPLQVQRLGAVGQLATAAALAVLLLRV